MANRRERWGRRKRHRKPSHRKIRKIDGADFINSMPDDILNHILSFIPTDLAMRTSVLSKRWRHVWYETPCLDINVCRLKDGATNQTLTSYTAPKITSFKLLTSLDHNTAPEIDSWIEFAISRNVQNLSVFIRDFKYRKTYSFPVFFYLSSSLKQLTVTLDFCDMIPTCIVSWESLRNLSLRSCRISDESIHNILSGCPILESLTLDACSLLERLELSKAPSLKRLDINREYRHTGPIAIVAPHIHYLRLTYSSTPSTLVDVSSLIEANLNIISSLLSPLTADRYQTMALEMLAKSHNVKRLTVGETLLQILSLAELRGVPFPTLKVQTLIVKTEFVRSVIPGISRLLQNSPGLKKLTLHTMQQSHDIMDMHRLKGLYPDQCWRSKCEVFPTSKEIYEMLGCNDATSKLVASFSELVLRNAKTLEMMVVWLGGSYFNDAQWFEELLQMVETLSHDNNVSILLKRSNS
ncbi:Leucine-rich repeat 2 [Arabidopsis suecica]|uniref:Leucine-rich repeat 2 n=1 Tax=Arabidopsis suecica TaxID=45249 RepID=A0A8T1Z6T9_ARASU|nr:Leucine-rich repeat 2 [Arabidopsis suecica]